MQIVVVSAGPNREAVRSAMARWSIDPLCCSGVQEARRLLQRDGWSLIFCEEQLSDGVYRDLLNELPRNRRIQMVVISSAVDLDRVHQEASELGAFGTIASPCTPSDVQWVAIRALQEGARCGSTSRRQEFDLSESRGRTAQHR